MSALTPALTRNVRGPWVPTHHRGEPDPSHHDPADTADARTTQVPPSRPRPDQTRPIIERCSAAMTSSASSPIPEIARWSSSGLHRQGSPQASPSMPSPASSEWPNAGGAVGGLNSPGRSGESRRPLGRCGGRSGRRSSSPPTMHPAPCPGGGCSGETRWRRHRGAACDPLAPGSLCDQGQRRREPPRPPMGRGSAPSTIRRASPVGYTSLSLAITWQPADGADTTSSAAIGPARSRASRNGSDV